MSTVTVKQLSEIVGTPVERLLEQLKEAGIAVHDPDQQVSDSQKMQLLEHLRHSHGSSDESAAKQRITLKRRSTTELKVGSSTGRAKTISVEVRKKRTIVRDEEQPTPEPEVVVVPPVETVEVVAEAAAEPVADVMTNKSAILAKQFEADRRRLEDARKQADEGRLAEDRARQEQEELKRVEAERREAEERAKREAEEAELRREKEQVKVDEAKVEKAKPKAKPAKARGERENHSARKELHVASDKRGRRKGGKAAPRGRGASSNDANSKHGFAKPTAPIVHEVAVPEVITVADLAQRMAVKASEVIKALMGMGVMATINQSLDQDTAILVVEELGHIPKATGANDVETHLEAQIDDDQREQAARPPVVTIMGHVDHGKTSLLDYIRRTKVAAGEAGGITQHIGAYHVETPRGSVTFLDTPGHAAFTAMRARGAQATDVVVLVVAADDGVMPQTIEAIQHARAAGVPIVVAVNKIDKPEADLDRVRTELSAHEVISEAWGGDTQFVPVSAKTGEGVDNLIEAIQLQAELLELKAPFDGPASGVVIESSLDKGRGPVATVLVQKGRLNRGDILLSGQEFGRVRAMLDESGREVPSAGPSTPVVVLGLSGTPNAGDDALVVADDRKAREVAEFRHVKVREAKLANQQAAKLENLFNHMQEGGVQTVNLLLKADVQGSAEALRDSLQKLSTDEVKVKIVSSGVGGIAESDVNLALASQAIIIGFNVRADVAARRLSTDKGVDLRYYSVIYEVIDDVRQALSGLLSPEMREQIVGLAQVRDVFRSSRMGPVAGCLVIEGMVRRGNPIRVLRDNVVVYEGELESLRRFKDDVNEVRVGTECGIAVKNYNDVRPGDQIEVFEKIEVERSL
ncbi:translation initiation factor IF-2 [Acidihalobacter yilgarnensis]|uniref:Translation initiation factor IF-2 n=1 Tax=Acidihalobacter yilgarnensis TaxID=2819280 RepID=A0A1D8IMA3_9GAMM|nr:translation initiation factor IF-2 [Acidihalobacter yilgarnensis]AOU97545.1 translation initiation factor IF-2 [Acidihalobacter yilgarnensis]